MFHLISVEEKENCVVIDIAGFIETYDKFFDLTYVNLYAEKTKEISYFKYDQKVHNPWDKKDIDNYYRKVKKVELYNRFVWPILKWFKFSKKSKPFSCSVAFYGGIIKGDY